MVSLSEMFEPKMSGPSFVIPTYTAQEAGNMNLSYQLEMTVNASIRSPSKRQKLMTFVTMTMGYQCAIDSHNNTVKVTNLEGINISRVFNFIQQRIDPHATMQPSG